MSLKERKKPIKLYFLTGFLGSGKTTLLLNMLSELAKKDQKAGVIVNEFGQVGVDGKVIQHRGIEITELNDGQIFCGCMQGKFVETIVAFAGLPLDYLIVECSGLANPTTLETILENVKSLTGEQYDYQGMICLVDPVKFLILVQTVNAVEEQIIRSQYIIINKIDLVDEETIKEAIAKIRDINPHAPFTTTSFAKIDGSLFDLDLLSTKTCPKKIDSIKRNVKIPYKRPKHYLINTKEIVNSEKIKKFTKVVINDAFRIKGFVNTEKGYFYLDAVNDTIDLKPMEKEKKDTEIVVISSIWERIEPLIEVTWSNKIGTPVTIKENVF